jgi:hypothetical protein
VIKPEPHVIKALAGAVRQFPDLLDWINAWYRHELESLPMAINNPAVGQGRCQVLGELAKFANDSPSLAAKLK